MRNTIEFKITGDYALFSDPVTRSGGEKSSYHIPTYEALKGIVEAIYWKPTITWVIDKVRIIKPIRTESKSIKLRRYSTDEKSDLAKYSYLQDVEYQVSAHFEWNENRTDLLHDRNEHKHHNMAKRYLEKGGKRDVFLGTRECLGYVEPCVFGEGSGYYDNYGNLEYGNMYHSFSYPKKNEPQKLYTNFWSPVLINGVIEYCKPHECNISREVMDYDYIHVDISSERDEYEKEVYNELVE